MTSHVCGHFGFTVVKFDVLYINVKLLNIHRTRLYVFKSLTVIIKKIIHFLTHHDAENILGMIISKMGKRNFLYNDTTR